MRHDPAGVLDQMVEQPVFGGAQADALAVDDHLTPLHVHLQPLVDGDDLVFGAAVLLKAAQHGADAAG